MYKLIKKKGLGLIVLYTIIHYIWILYCSINHINNTLISNILLTIPPILSFIFLLNIYTKSKEQKDIFWLLLVICSGSQLLLQLVWNFYEIILGILNPHNILTIILWASKTISLVTALSIKILEKNNDTRAKFFIIDILIVMCIAAALTWIYSVLPNSIDLTNLNLISMLIYLGFPMGNLLSFMLAVYLYIIIKPLDSERKFLTLICLSSILMFVSNTIYTYLADLELYLTYRFIDPLWSLYILLLGLAAIQYYYMPKTDDPLNSHNQDTYQPKLVIVIPFISVILLFLFMLSAQNEMVWIFSAISITLIALRHAFTMKQNNQLISKLAQLKDSLEIKVTDRTRELYNMAFYDQLTGLPNRRMFEHALEQAVLKAFQSQSTLALMFLDLDRFKTINDNFGHSYGDVLLKEISSRIKTFVQDNLNISRQGGDEFAIIVEGFSNQEELMELAQKILNTITIPIHLEGQCLYTTCSIGIALYSNNYETPETLMRYADSAMYYSKEKGKNNFQFYTDALDKSLSRKLELETALSQALANQEFLLYYQPQIDTSTNDLIGAEALLRWQHPKLGFISPADFIPIAEECGMIKDIGLWVLETACIQAKKWHHEGYSNLKVGVNISPTQIQQDNFVELIAKVLRETELNPICLDLEITESASFQNETEIINKLKALKQLGVKISIDDFGTGYSSLSYLNKLPIDTLKIAQEFVKNLKNDTANEAIISTIIAVSHSLGLNVIAEGVEEEYQYHYLKSQKCFDMQGYIFSKPITDLEFWKIIISYSNNKQIELDA